ncbi:MAG: HlyD family secretion protein [Eubacterium callanderi]|uniref:HlyD family secretion protein n=1 Tax=Eubacterium callanderi TaxID=53442 RepID=UPI00399648BD
MKIYHYSDLKDSRIMYDRNPPVLFPIIVLLVLVLVIVLIFLSIRTDKTYVVKGQGMVQSNELRYIMSEFSGEIMNCAIEENKEVQTGEILGVVNSPDLALQKQQIEGQIAITDNRIQLLSRLESNLKYGTNTFDPNDSVEAEFYNRIAVMDSSQAEQQLSIDQINDELMKKQGMTDEQIQQYKDTYLNKQQQIFDQTLAEATKEKAQYQAERDKLQVQSDTLETGKNEYTITAPITGVLHTTIPVADGMVIQAGSAIATLSGKDNLYFETSISSSDRSKIDIGDPVEIAVNGLLETEFGTLKGKVTDIDADATIQEKDGNIYFKAKVQPDANCLFDKENQPVYLTSGMTAEVRVKYDKISYYNYFLDALGIRV